MEEFEVLAEEAADEKSCKKRERTFFDILWFQFVCCLGVATFYFIFRIVDDELCEKITQEISKIHNTATPEMIENILNDIKERIDICFRSN